jgi:Na+/melibiose symporter-like transporter
MGLVCLVISNTREAVKRSLDLAGLLTLAVFLVSLLIALTQGQREGWDTPYIQRLLLVAGGSFVVFLGLELTRKEPLVDLRLYKNLAFTAVSLAVLLNAMNFCGTNFLQTILLQRLMDYTPAQAGYAVLPGALGMALTTPWAGRLADKIDRRYVVLGGLTMFALASYWFLLHHARPLDGLGDLDDCRTLYYYWFYLHAHQCRFHDAVAPRCAWAPDSLILCNRGSAGPLVWP